MAYGVPGWHSTGSKPSLQHLIIPTVGTVAGEVAEWSIAAVLKTAAALPPTGVRIPPSPPARDLYMQESYIWIIVWVAVVGGLFAWLWRAGHLARFTNYIQQTREELRKCTWPSWDELKGSTVVVFISIIILGGFTVLVDQIFFRLFYLLKL